MSEQGIRGTQLIGSVRDRAATSQELQQWREQLVRRVLRVMVAIGLLTVVVGSYYRFTQQKYVAAVLFWFVYGFLLFINFEQRLSYAFRVRGILFLLYGFAFVDFLLDGRAGGARLFLGTYIFAAALLLGRQSGLYALVISLGTSILFAFGFITGFFPTPIPVSSVDLVGWTSSILVLAILGTFILASTNYLIPRLIDAMAQSGRLTRELTDYQSRLEDLIASQEVALARRSTQLNTAAQVAQEAAQFRDMAQVLDRTVRLISEHFGFYHAGLFLVDETGEYAVLQAASSEGGQVMLARGHHLKVGEEGIVGYAVQKGVPRIALDVGEDAVFFNNPDLPGTRSEIALPLRSRQKIIGVLDVQSTDSGAFTDEDVVVLQTLADQVALVISNAQLVQQVEGHLNEQQRLYRQMGREAWSSLATSLENPGFIRNARGISPAGDVLRPRMVTAARTGTLTSEAGVRGAVAIPIKVRGQVVGVIDARKRDDTGAWTPEELELLETMGTQLDPALDSAQLYQDSQLRANREQFTREVADKMRRAVDMDALIRTTLEELSSVLDVSSTFVQLTTPAEPGAQNGDPTSNLVTSEE